MNPHETNPARPITVVSSDAAITLAREAMSRAVEEPVDTEFLTIDLSRKNIRVLPDQAIDEIQQTIRLVPL
jgi:hypothetical protein